MADKKGFIMYVDILENIEPLNMEQRGVLLTALLCDQRGDDMPDMDVATQVAFSFIKKGIDANTEKYNRIAELRREAGKRGGRPPKQTEANESKENQKKANENKNKQTEANENNGEAKKPDNSKQITDNSKQITDNNIFANANINTRAREEKPKEQKHKYGEYQNVLLTDTELEKLKTEFPFDWQERIDNLSRYMRSKGATYKDHLATIRNWARRDNQRGFTASAPAQAKNKAAEQLHAFYDMAAEWASEGE